MKWLWACCFALACAGVASALDREAFTFTRYDLNATIDPSQQRLGFRGKITLRNNSDSPQRTVVLQVSSSLHWVSIQIDGKPAEFITQTFTSDIDHTGALSEAILSLPKPISPKERLDLTIGYEGIIEQDATRLTRIGVPANLAKRSDWDQISSASTAVRGIGYVAWYPIATEAVNMSERGALSQVLGRWKEREHDSKINFCMPSTVLMNDQSQSALSGVTAGDVEGGHSSSCSQHEFPHAGDTIPVFAAGEFREIHIQGVSVRYLAGHKSGAEDYVAALKQVGPSVSVWLGGHSPGTANTFQVIDLPDAEAAPFQSGNTLFMPLATDESTMLLTAVQQVAQLDLPSPRTWITQGLARYVQVRYIEQEKGREGALQYLETHRDPLLELERPVPEQGSPAAAARSLVNSPDEFYVQTKAMNVWWMLRELVGETALTAALHNYKAGEDRDALYMQKLIEKESHRDLTWFFDDWVYRDRGLPDLRIDSVHARSVVSGGFLVTVTVENLGAAAAEVPVKLEMTTGEAAEKLIVPGKSKASVRILAATTPTKAIVNDGSVPEAVMDNNEYTIDAESLNH